MLITGEQIKKDGLLKSAASANISGGCYYLQIHSIIPAGEAAKEYDVRKPHKFHTLEPGGIAWIISQESFEIKDTSITALVTLRSGFTKKGMLALDVGLVDANYSGPIGTLVINFSKNHIRLKEGDQFFRVMFLKHDEVLGIHAPKTVTYTHDQYVEKILSDMVGGFPSTFLQADEMEARIREDLKRDLAEKLEPDLLDALGARFIKNNWGKMLGVLAGVLLLGQFFGVSSYFHSSEQIRGVVDERLEELRLGVAQE